MPPESSGAARVAVVVLNYRFPEITLRCLASLAPGDPGDFAVFLVDNSPEDGAGEALRGALAATGREHRYIASPFNGGFGSGMNLGIRAAMDAGFSHVAVLNNDTIAAMGFGANLRGEVAAHPMDILAGLILDTDTGEPSFNIGRLNRATLEVEHILQREYRGRVDFVSGCFAVFPVVALRSAGLFREDYFLYAEDTELCLRMKQAGFAIRFCPSIVISHRPGSSSDRTKSPKQYYLIRNHTRLVCLHGTFTQKAAHTLYMTATLINQMRHPKIFRVVWYGLLDALRGRMGKRDAAS